MRVSNFCAVAGLAALIRSLKSARIFASCAGFMDAACGGETAGATPGPVTVEAVEGLALSHPTNAIATPSRMTMCLMGDSFRTQKDSSLKVRFLRPASFLWLFGAPEPARRTSRDSGAAFSKFQPIPRGWNLRITALRPVPPGFRVERTAV